MFPAAHPEPLIQRLYSACVKVAHDFRAADSPWERVPMDVPSTCFGPGSLCPFSRYFEGESHTRVTSIDAIAEWLQGCRYVSDFDQFHERDVWQSPCAFELSRCGDCEDFALWAWRKLTEIGVEAEFYVGRVESDEEPERDRQHAWVVYRVGLEEFLFEPAAGSATEMIRRLSDVQDDYVPHFAVNRRFVTSAFVGCILDSDRIRRRSSAAST